MAFTGLWNERLYKLFDYEKNKKLSFEEFLTGIAKFTKYPKEDKIKVLFHLYDANNSLKIEKNEFMKMLFNFPKTEIN